jgi:glycosyltransferase involved in cell wall biosynthesis
MLRVLTLSSLFPNGARPYAGGFVERQTLALAKRPDVAVKVVAPLGLPYFPWSLERRWRALRKLPKVEVWKGLEVHRPQYRLLHRFPRLLPGEIARRLLPVLRDIRRDFPFDVIDAQVFWPDGPAAMRLAKALDVPFSIKGRGDDILHWGRQAATAGLLKEAGEGTRGLLAVSGGLRDRMIELGMPGDKIAVHYTGVDRSVFRLRERSSAKAMLKVKGPLLLSVGNLISRKGHRFAIDAAAALDDSTLWIVGGGPDAAELQARIDKLGLGDRVRLIGHSPHVMLPVLLAAAAATILATSGEGLANVWVESLACGTPVVTTDVSGAREAIDRPEAGRIVARDPAAIAAAVRELLADPPDPEKVRAASDKFSWEANAEQLEAHLRRLAGK